MGFPVCICNHFLPIFPISCHLLMLEWDCPIFQKLFFPKIRILVHLYFSVSLSKLACHYVIIMLFFIGILFLIIRILLHLHFPFLCLIVMTSCTYYASTNFGGLRPSYSYVGLTQKWVSRTFFCGSWGFACGSGSDACLSHHPHIHRSTSHPWISGRYSMV